MLKSCFTFVLTVVLTVVQLFLQLIGTVLAVLFLTGLIWDNSLTSSEHRASPVSEPGTCFIEKGTLNISPSSLTARIITVSSSFTQ